MAMNGDREQLNLYLSPTVATRFRTLATRLGFGRRPSPLLEKLLDTFEWSTQPRSAADARCAYTSALMELPPEAIVAEVKQFLLDACDLVNQSGDPEAAIRAGYRAVENHSNPLPVARSGLRDKMWAELRRKIEAGEIRFPSVVTDLFESGRDLCPACEHGGVANGSKHVPSCWLYTPSAAEATIAYNQTFPEEQPVTRVCLACHGGDTQPSSKHYCECPRYLLLPGERPSRMLDDLSFSHGR